MDARIPSRPLPGDLLALAGLVALMASLAMPWWAEQTCAPMNECTPWTHPIGWDVAGWPLLGVAVLSVVAFQAPLRPSARRLVPFLLLVFASLVLAAVRGFPFEGVFTEARGVDAGYVLAVGGIVAGLVGLTWSLRDIAAGRAGAAPPPSAP